MAFIETIVGLCCRHARVVVAAFVLAAIAAAAYTATHFKMDTDSEKLISPKLDWRKREARFDALFPQQSNLILVVIDGATPELAGRAQALLADRLGAQKKLFPIVRQPGGGDFFLKNGLLFFSQAEVKKTTQQLIAAQPFLAGLAADPSLRGVMDSLSTALMGVQHGQATLEQLDKPISAFGDTLGAVADGRQTYLSWSSLVTGTTDPSRRRSFIEVQPALNFDALSPGAAASDAIRAAARDLKLTPDNGVRVRLTGPVPLSDEEFATLAERADLMGIVMLLAVTLTLWLAVKSFRIIACILAALFTGLALTMGIGLAVVGVFNIISIAFVALFVGLGVDFGIQYCVRYRAERHVARDLMPALVRAGHGVGKPLALAAAATAAGFFSFLPTKYVGVAELGLIAGIGMVVAFVLAITMLPALMMLIGPHGEAEDVGFRSLAPVDRFLRNKRRFVLTLAAAAGLASLVSIPFLHFDFDPLHLRSAKVESVSTLYDLMKDPQTSPNTIDVLARSLDQADALGARLSTLPEVGQVLTLKSFVPEDQPPKLALISDASFLLDAAINPFVVKPQPSDTEVVASLTDTAKALRAAAGAAPSQAGRDALRLASILDRLAGGEPSTRERATRALIPGLQWLLHQLQMSLQAAPVSLNSMPADFVRDWVAPDGTARIQVFPKDTSGTDESLRKFGAAVTRVVPDATGAPLSIRHSGDTIMGAFLQAGLWAFVAITILLFIVLRRTRDVLLTLIPLFLSGLLTLGTCVLIGLQLNFANVIALPLLLGIGVAFDIYFVVAWRAGAQNLLQSSLTRAVIFSALTTASGFGTLWLSSHPGTASMGELLMISLGWTLITTLFFLPALLGPSPATSSSRRPSR
ncbi:MAG TPA: MMPL family transporter [Rhizomicrobium sp.]|nr:MMPL family transporter [Rhizomicrobium sp.]